MNSRRTLKKIQVYKRFFTLFLAVCMLVTMTPQTGISVQAAEKIKISKKTLTLKAGESKTLKLKNVKKKDIKKIKWSSSKKKVATVSKKGKVKAVGIGKAKITAKYKGKKYVCKVTVKAADEAVPSAEAPASDTLTQTPSDTAGVALSPAPASQPTTDPNAGIAASVDDLKSKLSDKSKAPAELTFKTDAKENIEIPDSVVAKDTVLTVDAPNATITNKGEFKKVIIKNIAQDTWIEDVKADPDAVSVLDMQAETGHIKISENAKAEITVSGNVKKLHLSNSGTVTEVHLNVKAELIIDGDNVYQMPVTAGENAEGASIITEIPLDLNVKVKIRLTLRPGAANGTTVDSLTKETIPDIIGVGIVEVTVGDTVQHIVADSTGISFDAKGTVSGYVYDLDGNYLEGASVYLVNYPKDYNGESGDTFISGVSPSGSTNSDGYFELGDVNFGNYLLIIKKEGYAAEAMPAVLAQDNYYVGSIMLLTQQQKESKGDITGLVNDSAKEDRDGDLVPVTGAAIYIRKGLNNTTGRDKKEAYSDMNGKFTFSGLSYGNYCIQAVKEGYMTAAMNVTVKAETNSVQVNLTNTTTLTTGKEVQFILHWDQAASDHAVSHDLDSHLTGPGTGKDTRFHIYYSHRKYFGNETGRAADYDDKDGYYEKPQSDLDHDDVDYEGPETTTIRRSQPGIYHFYVYDYANQSDRDNKALGSSHPWVEVKQGAATTTFRIPDGSVGTLWEVCSFDSRTGKLTADGSVYYFAGNSETVGSMTYKEYISDLFSKAEKLGLTGDRRYKDAKDGLENAKGEEQQKLLSDLISLIQETLDKVKIESIDYPEMADVDFRNANSGSFTGSITVSTYGDQVDYDKLLEGVSFTDESVKKEIKDSDDPAFEKMLTATLGKVVINYYIVVKELDILSSVSGVTDDVSSIEDYTVRTYSSGSDDGEDKQTEEKYLYVRGGKSTLTDPVFSFRNERISGTYKAGQANFHDLNAVGTLTFAFNGKSYSYPVVYEQDKSYALRKISRVTCDNNNITYKSYGSVYDNSTEAYKYYYEVKGTSKDFTSPVFTTNNENVSVSYKPYTDEEVIVDSRKAAGEISVTWSDDTFTYPLVYEYDAAYGLKKITKVIDPGNLITYSDDDSQIINNNTVYYYYVKGISKSLSAPEFTGYDYDSDNDVKVSYLAYTDGLHDLYPANDDDKHLYASGEITVTCQYGTYTYPLVYEQDKEHKYSYRDFAVADLKQDGELTAVTSSYYKSVEDENGVYRYRYWYVKGTADDLTGSVPEFEKNVNNYLAPDTVNKVTASDNEDIGSYMFTYTYGGQTFKDYIKYEKTENFASSVYLSSILKSVSVSGNELYTSGTYWYGYEDTIATSDAVVVLKNMGPGYECSLEQDGSKSESYYQLTVKAGNNEAKYSIYYYPFKVGFDDIVTDDNELRSSYYSTSGSSDDKGTYSYISVTGVLLVLTKDLNHVSLKFEGGSSYKPLDEGWTITENTEKNERGQYIISGTIGGKYERKIYIKYKQLDLNDGGFSIKSISDSDGDGYDYDTNSYYNSEDKKYVKYIDITGLKDTIDPDFKISFYDYTYYVVPDYKLEKITTPITAASVNGKTYEYTLTFSYKEAVPAVYYLRYVKLTTESDIDFLDRVNKVSVTGQAVRKNVKYYYTDESGQKMSFKYSSNEGIKYNHSYLDITGAEESLKAYPELTFSHYSGKGIIPSYSFEELGPSDPASVAGLFAGKVIFTAGDCVKTYYYAYDKARLYKPSVYYNASPSSIYINADDQQTLKDNEGTYEHILFSSDIDEFEPENVKNIYSGQSDFYSTKNLKISKAPEGETRGAYILTFKASMGEEDENENYIYKDYTYYVDYKKKQS